LGDYWNMSAEGRAKISAAAKRRYEGRSRQLQCQQCGIRYTAIESQIARGRGKFCSRDCKGRASRGVSVAAQTEFKPGIVPWNKGLELPEYSGDKSPSWKAEDISYSGLHRWVRRHIGVKNYCEHCLRSNLARYDLANKTGVYDRRPENWITLCRRCHIKFDSRDPKRPSMRGYSLDRQWVK